VSAIINDLSIVFDAAPGPIRTTACAMMTKPRLYLLDTLRGLASLSIVVWHYQHFFFADAGVMAADFTRSAQPYYSVFKPIYQHGAEAVQLFFVMSGFIFFFTYYSAIAAGQMTVWRFVVLRFSRLYPLHFATLVIVAVGQFLSYRIDGRYIVYEFNDGWHFATQLMLASNWEWQPGHSFNGPIWSVSLEVVLYAMFFALARYLSPLTRRTAMAALAMFSLSSVLHCFAITEVFANPAKIFFAGGVVYAIWDAVRARCTALRLAITGSSAVAAMTSVWLYTFWASGSQQLYLIGFPASILCVAMLQDWFPNLGRRVRVIGDITYATYLVHFPLQLVILLAAKQFNLVIDFYSSVTFVLYFSSVVLVSILTYHFFELPMQQFCRRKLLGPSPTQSSSTPQLAELPCR
jgi:peptidoglycan/LPS O-acetylase OafA/YrhL